MKKVSRFIFTAGEKRTTDDNDWRIVELPHDCSIEDLPVQPGSVTGAYPAKSINRLYSRR